MIFLGFGKYARADKIYALEPLDAADRGNGRRTRVWVEGVTDPIVASRTERTILHEMGQDHGADSAIIDEALGLAERLSEAAEQGKVDLGDLGRRAKRLLEKTAKPPPTRSSSSLPGPDDFDELPRRSRTRCRPPTAPVGSPACARSRSTLGRCTSRATSACSGAARRSRTSANMVTFVAVPFQLY